MSTRIMSACWPLRMPPPAKAVLISLADMANDEGFCWPSIERVCERTCFGRTAVIDGIAWLEAHGVLKANRSNGRKTTYVVSPDQFSETETVVVTARRGVAAGEAATPSVDKSLNQSATRTGTPRGPVRQTDSTSPPDGLNQSATRTLTVKNHQETSDTPVPPNGGARTVQDSRGTFADLVALWPPTRRSGAHAARPVFDAALARGVSAAEMVDAARLQSAQPWWTRDGGRYVPKLQRWLREERWRDGEIGQNGEPAWMADGNSIRRKAAQLGLSPWDRAAFESGSGETFTAYTQRVVQAAAAQGGSA